MAKMRLWAVFILILGFGVGYFDYATEMSPFGGKFEKIEKYPLRLGLDLSGGTHLVYRADTSKLPGGEVRESMAALRDVIERRVNLFGVAEPLVQTEKASFVASDAGGDRLIVEFPGLTDTEKAIATIGQTPVLEFKTERNEEDKQNILAAQEKAKEKIKAQKEGGKEAGNAGSNEKIDPLAFEDAYYIPTELTGRYLKKSSVEFDPNSGAAQVSLVFTDEGAALFEQITKDNVGKTVAIYLDGAPISAPVVREAISGGKAQISGNFTVDEAKQLVGRLNAGALPVPIELLSAQTIGASLGGEAYQKIIHSGIIGILAVMLFLIIWYRLPGLLASFALSFYVAIMIALFKFIPITLTSAGMAGFILSVGMAVDANILIFERMKEELARGRVLADAIREGFDRAWSSIRDSNLSSIISSVILFWFGTSLVQGFALTLGIGVLVSLFTALTVTRTLLLALGLTGASGAAKFIFGNGLRALNNPNDPDKK